MSGFTDALDGFESVANTYLASRGASAGAIATLDSGVAYVEAQITGENALLAVTAIGVAAAATALLGTEVVAGLAAAAVGEEAVAGAAYLVDQAALALYPSAFSVASGTAVVATVSAIAGDYVLGQGAEKATNFAAAELQSYLSTSVNTVSTTSGSIDLLDPNSVVFCSGGSVNLPTNGINAVIGDDNTATGGSEAGVCLIGDNNSVSLGFSSAVTVTGLGNIAEIGNGSELNIAGSDNTVYGAANDYIYGSGQDNTIYALDSLVGFTGDTSGNYVDGTGDGGYGFDWGAGYGYGYGYDAAASAKAKNGQGIDKVALYDATSTASTPVTTSAQEARAEAYTSLAASEAGTTTSSQVFENAVWTSKVVTWSFAEGGSSSQFSSSLTAQEQAIVEQAFQAWGAASGLTFVESPAGQQADIQIGLGDFDTGDSSVLGYTSYRTDDGAFMPGVTARLEDGNETALVTNSDGQLAYSGSDATFYQVALHEIGHALGLADNADPNSVMYYQSTSANTALDTSDVAEIQALYGSVTGAASSPPGPAADAAVSALTADAGGPSAISQSLSSSSAQISPAVSQLIQAMATFSAEAPQLTASFIPANTNTLTDNNLAAHA